MVDLVRQIRIQVAQRVVRKAGQMQDGVKTIQVLDLMSRISFLIVGISGNPGQMYTAQTGSYRSLVNSCPLDMQHGHQHRSDIAHMSR